MYNFLFQYEDGTEHIFNNIFKVEYQDSFSLKVLQGEEMLQGNIPVNHNMNLFAENAKYSVSGKDLKIVSVLKVG